MIRSKNSSDVKKEDVVFPGKKSGGGKAKILFDKLMCRNSGRIIIKGLDNIPKKGAFLIVANHQSHADGPLVWMTIWSRRKDVWAIAGKVIADSEIREFYLDSYPGYIYVERREGVDSRTSLKIAKFAFNQAEMKLKSGTPAFVFSESTRSRTGALIEAQWRTILPALLANVPIIPCGIVGTKELFSYSESLVVMKDLMDLAQYVNYIDELKISFSEPLLLSEYLPRKDGEAFNG